MTKKTTLFFYISIFTMTSLLAQDVVVNDFDTVTPTIVTRYNSGITSFFVESNPNTTGNTSATVGRVIRNSGNWFELFGFDLDTPYTVAAGETRYLHVYVLYPAEPDVSVRMNSEDASADGGPDVRALNTYTDFGEWQDLVFQLDGGSSGATVNSILMLPDLGFENDPAGFVLNNTDAFAYIDNFRFNDSATPETLSTNQFELANSTNIYPNPTSSTFKLDSNGNIIDVSLYSVLGKKIAEGISRISTYEYNISGLASGMYLVKITDDNGSSVTKRLMKQ